MSRRRGRTRGGVGVRHRSRVVTAAPNRSQTFRSLHRNIQVMSTGRINIMTQRPLFRELKILTSKYFEIFSADTIPLVMIDPDHAEMVYGPAGRELALCNVSARGSFTF